MNPLGVIAIPTTFRLHSLHNNKYGTDHFYSTKPDGYCSDEDNEQPSAWDVFSALGFYPMCPGPDEYAVGSPLFRKATIHLENDNDIEIEASENCLENRYVGKITLNGNVPKQLFIECAELLKGRKFSSIWDLKNMP